MSGEGRNHPEFGFVGEDGEFITFDQIAKVFPEKYPAVGEYDLPTSAERATLKGMDRFYDLFQVVYIDEEQAASKYLPEDIGWYWVTYFEKAGSGIGYIGPFSDEHRALNHACAHALPLNDPRRKKYLYGYIGTGAEMCCSVPPLKRPGGYSG